MSVKELIAKIKEKKEFNAIEDRFVRAEVIKYFKQNPKAMQAVQEGRARSEEYKQAVKHVRAVLRRVYGVFLTKASQEREKYLESGDYEKILETHLSTKERLPIYPVIYAKIFAITGEPKVILDLGCGMNPVSYPFMKTDAEYYASDLTEADCDFLDKCFKKLGIKGKATPLNLIEAANNPEMLKQLPKADICFLFKVLDEIERKKGRKTSEALIKAINADWLVISFATKKVTGKPMKYPFRRWLEQMLTRLGYEFKLIKEGNEIFYVVRKKLK
ncbi:hypothetical protein KY338_03300 [Candidatus Woesearchaeota archaeon]|nr:hypothetical protein [Candidatus Woesearchaeota archaeon]MBW3005370.1 hypothetical protein [Candidatus Woesearchaeota archaeon]